MSRAALAGACLLLVALPGRAGQAQTVKERLDVTRQAVETQRRVLVSGALPLSDAEARAFWPLYDAYEKERRPLDDRFNRLVADFVAGNATLTEAQAKAMLDEAQRIDEARVKLRGKTIARMAGALSARKLLRFFQIDNKLDSVVRADVARQVPLAP
jgi:hypothetical protein